MRFEPKNNHHINLIYFVVVVLFAMLFLLGSGCSTDADLDEGPIPFEILAQHSSGGGGSVHFCSLNMGNLDFSNDTSITNLGDIELVIANSTDYTTYMSCADSIHIDFDTEFVLAGFTRLTSTHGILKQEVVFYTDTLRYRVEVSRVGWATPGTLTYIVKLSREFYQYPVVFDIYWEEER